MVYLYLHVLWTLLFIFRAFACVDRPKVGRELSL